MAEIGKISKCSKAYCLRQNGNIKHVYKWCSWPKRIFFAPKQGCITLRVWLGFREEIPASDSLRLIMDGSDYLFIHLSAPLLSFPLSACSVFYVRKRGQPGGKEDEAKNSFILGGGRETTEAVLFLDVVRIDATHSRLLQVTCHTCSHRVSDLLWYYLLVTRRLGEQVSAVAAVL